MENDRYLSVEFWNDGGDSAPVIFWNFRSKQYDVGLVEFVEGLEELKSHLLFSTSGTTGNAKWVCLSKTALLASAKAVVDHLKVKTGDIWFQALPIFHVGGFGLYARAFLTQGAVVQMDGHWSAEGFVEQLRVSKAAWISLVPTQLADLVELDLKCPNGVKGVIVGGGAACHSVVKKAISLGWPILQSYGMSEAGSQIATATSPGGEMEVLDHVELKLSEQATLLWKGASKYSGYVSNLEFIESGEWVQTNDRVQLESSVVKFLSRSDRVVKILGELVDVDALEAKIDQAADQQVVLRVEQHPRRGYVLVPLVEQEPSVALLELLGSYKGLETLQQWQKKTFPRTDLGKVIKFNI